MRPPLQIASIALAAAFLAGCASVGVDDALKETNSSASQFTGGKLELSRTEEQREARAALSQELLGKPRLELSLLAGGLAPQFEPFLLLM